MNITKSSPMRCYLVDVKNKKVVPYDKEYFDNVLSKKIWADEPSYIEQAWKSIKEQLWDHYEFLSKRRYYVRDSKTRLVSRWPSDSGKKEDPTCVWALIRLSPTEYACFSIGVEKQESIENILQTATKYYKKEKELNTELKIKSIKQNILKGVGTVTTLGGTLGAIGALAFPTVQNLLLNHGDVVKLAATEIANSNMLTGNAWLGLAGAIGGIFVAGAGRIIYEAGNR